MATRTISVVGGNWNDTAAWVEAAVPTSADDVVATALSGNLTINVAAACRSIDLTSYVGTLTHNSSITLSVGDGSGGALKFVSGMTYTKGSTTSSAVAFVSTADNGGAGWNIDVGGKDFGNVTFDGVGGKWKFIAYNANSSVNTVTTLTNGHIDANGVTSLMGRFASTNSNTRTLTLGAASWTIRNTGTAWDTGTATNLTMTANTATITISGAGATFSSGTKDFNGMSLVMNNTTQVLTASGCTFNNVTKITGSATTWSLGAGFTCSGVLTLNGTNNATQRLTVQSNSGGSARTITANGSIVEWAVDFSADIVKAGSASWSSVTSTIVAAGTSDSAADATSYSTSSFTPTANRLLVVTVTTTKTTTPDDHTVDTATGIGTLTWTKVRTVVNGAGTQRETMYSAPTGASPPTGVLQILCVNTQTGCSFATEEWAGLAGSVPTIVQSQSATNTGTTASVTLDNDLGARSAVTATFGSLQAAGYTPGTGFFEWKDATYTPPNTRTQAEDRLNGTSTTASATLASAAWVGIAAEITGVLSTVDKADTDSATVSESSQVGLSGTDSSTFTDALTSLAVTISLLDTVAFTETTLIGLDASETGTMVDSASVAASMTATDQVVTTETSLIDLAASELVALGEALVLAAELAVADSASLLEVSIIELLVVDSAAFTETVTTLNVTLAGADDATVLEVAAIVATLTDVDTAVVTDNGVVSVVGTGLTLDEMENPIIAHVVGTIVLAVADGSGSRVIIRRG